MPWVSILLDSVQPVSELTCVVVAAAYGPGDQGAINQFYEHSVKDTKLTQDFNAKPYHEFLSTAYIVHFHGPKPGDYLEFSKSGSCPFGWLCNEGMTHAFCTYALEWAKYVQDEDIGQQVQFVCSMAPNTTQAGDASLNEQTAEVLVDAVLPDAS